MGRRRRAFARAGVIAAVVLAADQLTKALVLRSVSAGARIELLPGLELTNVANSGVAFGVLSGGGPWLVALTFAALALLLVYFARHAAQRHVWLPVGLVLGGALGNLADRARMGAVVDFIDPVAWPAFNLADTAIVLGVLGLLVVVESRPRDERAPMPVSRPWPEPAGIANGRPKPAADVRPEPTVNVSPDPRVDVRPQPTAERRPDP